MTLKDLRKKVQKCFEEDNDMECDDEQIINFLEEAKQMFKKAGYEID